MKRLKKYLYLEVGIEFKACLYFCIILFYYFLFQILQGSFFANIIIMAEMVITAYLICYIQVYLLQNFDESEHPGKKGLLSVVSCSAFYTLISYTLNWFERNTAATIFYFFYMLLCYSCVFLAYKIKRDIDTAHLNQELELFKKREKEKKEADNEKP